MPPPPRGGSTARRARVPYTRGLHEVADRVWAWTLPDGGYGWSNAGLIAGDGASLLVDTLFDLALTREMLTAMQPITASAPITDAVITHSNGDHTHGNQLLDPSVRIIAAHGTAEEIEHGMAPEMLAMAQTANLGPVATPYTRERFGHFDFSNIKLRNADQTFERDLAVEVGGRRIDVLNLGPAHTAADSVVHVPDAGVLFGGDLLFIGCTPIVWAGPIANWVAACDAMIALDAPTVVPGHGPVTDPGWNPRGAWLSRARRRTGRGRLPRGPVVGRGRRHHRPRRVRDLAGRRARRRQRLSAIPRIGRADTAIGGHGPSGDAGRVAGQTDVVTLAAKVQLSTHLSRRGTASCTLAVRT